jgi:hypothetical protein
MLLAAHPFDAFLRDDRSHAESGNGISPPPPKKGIQAEAEQHDSRQPGRQAGLHCVRGQSAEKQGGRDGVRVHNATGCLLMIRVRSFIIPHVALAALTATAVPAQVTHDADPLARLTPSTVIQGFRAAAIYVDASGRPLGARFIHVLSGFTRNRLGTLTRTQLDGSTLLECANRTRQVPVGARSCGHGRSRGSFYAGPAAHNSLIERICRKATHFGAASQAGRRRFEPGRPLF